MNRWTFPLTGAVAGVVAAVAFAWVHALFISDIWFFIGPMIMAGAVSGLCVAGTFAELVAAPTLRRWVSYNATYVGLFVVLGVLSVILYEPVTTISALIALGEPPEHLFREVLPLTVAFTVGAAVVMTVVFGRRWWHLAPMLVTQTVLVMFLGLNVSVLGLVELPVSQAYLVAEVFGLIAALVLVFAAVLAALQWRSLRTPRADPELQGCGQ
jgi:hypothetical protein